MDQCTAVDGAVCYKGHTVTLTVVCSVHCMVLLADLVASRYPQSETALVGKLCRLDGCFLSWGNQVGFDCVRALHAPCYQCAERL
jgi:hypothetical protein